MRWSVPSSLLVAISSGSCLLFCDEGQPCDAAGNCSPGYVCVNTICLEAGRLERDEACHATAECKDGVCADVNCGFSCQSDADCFGDATCQQSQCSCQPRCRAGCIYPDNNSCDEGFICQKDFEQERGFCQKGQCDDDAGDSCPAPAECVAFHGPGSGICVVLCEILAQQECLGTPPTGTRCCAGGESCEHQDWMWNMSYNPGNALGLCVASGDRSAGAVCSLDPAQQWYCQRGLACDLDAAVCRRYCNLQGGQPACDLGQQCSAIGAAALPYGWCR